jgi:hypothetical protein
LNSGIRALALVAISWNTSSNGSNAGSPAILARSGLLPGADFEFDD